ncbi:hypothetical protein J2S46_003129 [Kitasatospora herbaricolor]|nr:hypothetical protein [Kitasatospora herbaricolor]
MRQLPLPCTAQSALTELDPEPPGSTQPSRLAQTAAS